MTNTIKKFLYGSVLGFLGFLIAPITHAGTYITFDTSFASSTFSTMGTLISDLQPYLVMILGVLILVVVISTLIGSLIH